MLPVISALITGNIVIKSEKNDFSTLKISEACKKLNLSKKNASYLL